MAHSTWLLDALDDLRFSEAPNDSRMAVHLKALLLKKLNKSDQGV